MSIISKNLSVFALDDYITYINKKAEMTMNITKINMGKIENENIIIPTISNYKNITIYNYNAQQLKTFAKYHKLKISGNKKELINRIYTYLFLSSHSVKIQKIFRGNILRKYIKLHGPAYRKRELCTNNSDFVTMEDLKDLERNQFFSYKDSDGFIYGFDMSSIYNLIYKNLITKKNCGTNPYNRNIIPLEVYANIKKILSLSNILGLKVNLDIEDDTKNISNEKTLELRVLTLFQNIDSLGNYSNPQWFLSLNNAQLIKLLRELNDIWVYRAQLSQEVKRKICPPFGDPFRNINIFSLYSTITDIVIMRKNILDILEKLVNTGIDRDSQALGAYYVLGALTLVNENAATSLPWLYQSVSYF